MTVSSTTSYDEVPDPARVHPATHPDRLAEKADLLDGFPVEATDGCFGNRA